MAAFTPPKNPWAGMSKLKSSAPRSKKSSAPRVKGRRKGGGS